jgi:hypothetical protein
VSGIRHVAVVTLVGLGLGMGCGSSDSSGPNRSAPTISDLVVLNGTNRALLLRMSATDPQGDVPGGSCIFRSTTFSGDPIMTVTAVVPPNPTAPLTVTCTLTVPSGLTGQLLRGIIAIADASGNVSNQLGFTTTLPEGTRGSG